MCRIFCTCIAMHDAMTDSARIGSQELSGTLPHCRTAPQPPVISLQHMDMYLEWVLQFETVVT